MSKYTLKHLPASLCGKDFYNATEHKIVDDDDWELFRLTGVPNCCGQIIFHKFSECKPVFSEVTDKLMELLKLNDREMEGIGSIIATSSEFESLTTRNFVKNPHWKKAYSFHNHNTDNKLTTWYLKYE